MPQFWSSFNLAPKRIQNGGWARQITDDDFKISTSIAGVNMRLGPGGVRELHWHQQAEWAVMTYGICRVTILDQDGRPQVADVKEGDLWYFPAGLPHSLQGLGPDGCEFVIAFDSGSSSEFNTLLVTDWIAHTAPEVLAKNFGVPAEAFQNIPLHNRWIYQSELQVPPLAEVEAQMASVAGTPAHPFVFSLGDMEPNRENKSGTVRIADSTNFHVSKTIAASRVTIKPGGLREMHWHPNADEWPYIIKGGGRATVFDTGPAAMTADFHAGDIGLIKKAFGHYLGIPATRTSSIWKCSARTALKRCCCRIGWRIVRSIWLPRLSTSIDRSSPSSTRTGPMSFGPDWAADDLLRLGSLRFAPLWAELFVKESKRWSTSFLLLCLGPANAPVRTSGRVICARARASKIYPAPSEIGFW